MKVKALVDVKENFYGIGEIKLKKGEVKDIPDEVFALWTNPRRQTPCVKGYVEEVKKEVKKNAKSTK